MNRRIIEAAVSAALLALTVGTAAAQCIGDANNNGFVNFADYGAVVQNFGQPCSAETRFVDNEDGTITDRWTGLMWEKKVALDGLVDLGNPHDADNVYRWAGTCFSERSKYCQPDSTAARLCRDGTQGIPRSCEECILPREGSCDVNAPDVTVWQWLSSLHDLEFGGWQDWRIPTRDELTTLLKVDFRVFIQPTTYSAFNIPACADPCDSIADPGCSCTRPYVYGTSSTFIPGSSGIWYVDFGQGEITANDDTSVYAARAVRGGPSRTPIPTITPTPTLEPPTSPSSTPMLTPTPTPAP